MVSGGSSDKKIINDDNFLNTQKKMISPKKLNSIYSMSNHVDKKQKHLITKSCSNLFLRINNNLTNKNSLTTKGIKSSNIKKKLKEKKINNSNSSHKNFKFVKIPVKKLTSTSKGKEKTKSIMNMNMNISKAKTKRDLLSHNRHNNTLNFEGGVKQVGPITKMVMPLKKFQGIFKKKSKKMVSGGSSDKKIINDDNFLMKRNIYEIIDISNLFKENGSYQIINNINLSEIKTKNVVCFINGQNLEIFHNEKEKNSNLHKKIIQIKYIKDIFVIKKNNNNIFLINYINNESKNLRKIGFLIEEDNTVSEYIQNLQKFSKNINIIIENRDVK